MRHPELVSGSHPIFEMLKQDQQNSFIKILRATTAVSKERLSNKSEKQSF